MYSQHDCPTKIMEKTVQRASSAGYAHVQCMNSNMLLDDVGATDAWRHTISQSGAI